MAAYQAENAGTRSRGPLAERYRPRTFAEVLGQPKAVATLERLCTAGGLGGRAVWLSGPSGTGKTTLARLAAESLADPLGIVETVARGLTVRDVQAIAATMRTYGLGQRWGRVWILNEAHGLAKPVIEALLDLLENLPAHVAVIFTTTRDGQDALFEDQIDAGPLLSRCLPVRLTNQGLAAVFARRVREIAIAEQLDGKPEAAYVRLLQECKNNMRAALQRVEAGDLAA